MGLQHDQWRLGRMALGEPDPDPPLPSWSLFVPGEPKSTQTGSIIRANGRAFPRYRNTDWSNRIALAAAASRPPAIFEGALKATLTFTRTRPTSLKKSVDYPTTRPDLDNMSKKLLDALEGIVYRDDAQLVMLTKVKRFGDTPGVAIRIEALPPLASLQLVAALYGLPATAEAGS